MNGLRTEFFVFFLICCLILPSCDKNPQDDALSEALERLDDVLEHSDDYVVARKLQISGLENLLNSRGVNQMREYEIYGHLFDAYAAFNFNKAKEAVDCQLCAARALGDESLVADALLSKAMLFTKSGLFLDANQVLENVDSSKLDKPQLAQWCNVMQRFDNDYAEYVKMPVGPEVREMREKYVALTDSTTSENGQIRMQIAMAEEDYEKASEINSYFLNTLEKVSHEYAIHAYWQAVVCSKLSKSDEALLWWIESAIADVKCAVKDNASLCSLALNLLPTQEVERAFRYIRISMDDALFYNAKLRQLQISDTLPIIEKAYLSVIAEKEKEKNNILIILSLIVLVLAAVAGLTVKAIISGRHSAREIEKKNRQITEYCRSIEDGERNLLEANQALSEANAAKEEYLGLFLSMCSGYIDKLKKHLSRQEIEAELKNFYKTFDTAFLQLYPNFVSDFNALLKEEERITLKDGEQLSTEMRIFALIKLGITQSSHIASLLRYSVNTIYNYRAQIKNAALDDRELFEEKVKKIGSKR